MSNPLLEAFKKTKYHLVGHGNRNLQVLKDALETLDGDQESDMYGSGKIIEEFQDKLAK